MGHPAMALEVERRLFTADEFQQMAEAGILNEDDRLELLDGEIVKMAPIGIPHAACVNRLNMMFARLVPEDWAVSVQNPVRLDNLRVLQPDLVILKPRKDKYLEGHPAPGDVALLIEVSDTTLPYDKTVKLPRYAQAGISEVWIVDLGEDCLEVYSDPEDSAFRRNERLSRGQTIWPQAFPGVHLDVAAILG